MAILAQQWPQQSAPTVPDSRQSFDAGAVEHAQEEGFRLVVTVVGGEQEAGIEGAPLSFEEAVAQPPRRGLRAFPSVGGFVVRAVAEAEGDAELLAQLLSPPGAVPGVGVKAMIVMGREELQLRGGLVVREIRAFRSELGEEGEEGRGIGAAGECDEDALAAEGRRVEAELAEEPAPEVATPDCDGGYRNGGGEGT